MSPRRVEAAVLFALALLTGACLTTGSGGQGARGLALSIEATDLDGDRVVVTGQEGVTTVLVIWATWCDSCPGALAWAHDVGAREGVVSTAINVDADRRMLQAHLEAAHPMPRVLWDPEGVEVARSLPIERVPTILIVGPDGVVRHVLVGWDDDVERALERLFGERGRRKVSAG